MKYLLLLSLFFIACAIPQKQKEDVVCTMTWVGGEDDTTYSCTGDYIVRGLIERKQQEQLQEQEEAKKDDQARKDREYRRKHQNDRSKI